MAGEIQVDLFRRMLAAREVEVHGPVFSHRWNHRLYRLRIRDWKRNSSSGALRVASQYIFNGQLLGSRPLKMANFNWEFRPLDSTVAIYKCVSYGTAKALEHERYKKQLATQA